MGRPQNCSCVCDSSCDVDPSCGGVRCTPRGRGIGRTANQIGYAGIGFTSSTAVDITPELGAGTASGLTIIDNTNADVVVACNRDGEVYRTEDRGDSWTLQTLGTSLNDVHSRGSNVIAVGDGGVIFRSVNQGQTWTAGSSGSSSELMSVWIPAANIGYACGASGVILKTTNGGATWAALSSGVSADLSSVHFFDKNNGFAVGAAGTIIRTTNAGATWTPISGTTETIDCVLMLAVDNVVMFSRTLTARKKWVWNGTTLTNAGGGPVIGDGLPLKMCGITCPDDHDGTKTQENGAVVSAYDDGNKEVTFFSSNGPLEIVTPTAQHQNRDGDASQYTASVKQWGGFDITSHSLATESDAGWEKPCLKHSVSWSQTVTPPISFPQNVAPPATDIEPLCGGWVVYELDGGPQITLADHESIAWLALTANTKLIDVSPPSAQSFARIIGTVTAGTWTITVDGQTTPGLSMTASLSAVESAVGALSTVNGNLSVTGWPINTPSRNGASMNNGCLYVLKWTDATARTISINVSGLTGVTPGGATAGSTLKNWRYEIVPVVIRDGVVYGPPFVVDSKIYGVGDDLSGDATTGAVESCWRYFRSGPDCPGQVEYPAGYFNRHLHSRYREFLENPKAIPNGFGDDCIYYCRGEDGFGDWENPTLERTVHSPSVPESQSKNWVPPTLSFDEGEFTVGFAVGFVSDVPGDYSAELLIDNVCLEWLIEAPPEPCGTLVLDEPMTSSLPTGWTQSQMTMRGLGGIIGGAVWRIEDGWMLSDHVIEGGVSTPIGSFVGTSPYYWRTRGYLGGSFWKATSGLSSADWFDEDFCLTVECEVGRLHEEDAEWYEEDQIDHPSNTTGFDLNACRPVEDFGIFIGGIAKFGVVRNTPPEIGSTEDPGPTLLPSMCAHTCMGSWYYLIVNTAIEQHAAIEYGTSGEDLILYMADNYYYCTDGTLGFCAGEGEGCHRVNGGQNELATGDWLSQGVVVAPPLKTCKLRLEVRWHGGTPSVNDCLADKYFRVRAYINDRPMAWMTKEVFDISTGNTSAGAVDITQIAGIARLYNSPSVGIYGHRGGKFRNFKTWITT